MGASENMGRSSELIIREEGKQNEELGRFIKGGDLRQKMSQGKIFFPFSSLDKETNVGTPT